MFCFVLAELSTQWVPPLIPADFGTKKAGPSVMFRHVPDMGQAAPARPDTHGKATAALIAGFFNAEVHRDRSF